ncbi:MAG: FAD:protein FMN transferase [Clostridia bacterium]|nr:FAD:protein FMN transferase [Clostridia bacterium]
MRKMRFAALLLALLLFCSMVACKKQSGKTKYSAYYFDYFDTVTTVVGYADSKDEFDRVCASITAQLEEYHRLYTIYNRYEGLNNLYTVNETEDGVHNVVQVDEKIMDLLLYAKEIYTLTGGRTNIAMGSVLSIWHEYREAGMHDPAGAELPPMDALRAAAEHTDIEQMILDTENNTVFLADPEMRLDVGAIAKGYAVEMVAQQLTADGIEGYILNVGGNVRAIGTADGDEPWSVGIENPDTEDTETPYIAYLHLSDAAVVTSGSYQRYYVVDGKNYHHIIDPETLLPGEKYLAVSVLCRDSALGDALSTALFLMDWEEGRALVEFTPNVEAMWTLPGGEQKYSSGFEAYTFAMEK